jgi:3'-phosphoadenosine 5'-phosphosulfate sulfotransferase (PAPS reductase)/FAD synthetase
MRPIHEINLHDYDGVLVNTSGGKDSQTVLRQVVLLAQRQGYDLDLIEAVHADLGKVEWEGVKELAREQAEHHGLRFTAVKRRTKDGDESTSLLDYVRDRRKWPSSTTRYCTSDFKRGPALRALTALDRRIRPVWKAHIRLLNVFGFRAEESPARAKKVVLETNKRATTKSRHVDDWLPIHDWTETDVWDDIKASGVRSHRAYTIGMPRLSCVFCIFAPKAALVIAGKDKPELLQEYVDLEAEIGHTFRQDLTLAEVQEAVNRGDEPDLVELEGQWNM